MMTSEENKAVLLRFTEEVFNRKNLAVIDDLLAPDEVDHTLPPNLPPNMEGTKQAIAMYLRAFPDVHVTIDDILAEGDRVAIRFTSRGTQRYAFGLIPPTRRRATISSYLIARFENGKIAEQWGLDDQLGMLMQLGLLQAVVGIVFLAGVGVGVGMATFVRKVVRG